MNTETIIWNLEQVVRLLKEQNMLLKKVFNSRDAAQYLGLSLDSLYHLTGKKLIPFYKRSNNRLVFYHEELEKYLLSNKQETKKQG